jgi:hypothetical protein
MKLHPTPVRLLATGLACACLAASALGQSTGTQYATFWRGDLRILAARPDTLVTILDVSTGLPLDPVNWTGNFTTNPFRLGSVGDSFEGSSRGATFRVRIVAETATGPVEPKPVVAWTGWLAPAIVHPFAPPLDQNAWASYIPDVEQGVGGSLGAELGRLFLGFSSRDMYVFAQKQGSPISITVEDLLTNTDADSDDNLVLDRTSPYLVHEDADVEIYAYNAFEDDTIRVTSNVPSTVLVGLIARGFPDWTVTPPSYDPGDGGRELGTVFYTFAARWLTIMPVSDGTTVSVVDLTDGDDTFTTTLTNGDRFNPSYDLYVADPTGRGGTQVAIPRPANPAVRFTIPPGGAIEDDLLKITSDRPVLVQVGPIASDTNEFADVAYSVPTGPMSQLIYCYAQNGTADDFQLFSLSPTNVIRITSLSYTQGFGGGFTDFTIPSPTPYLGGNATTGDWFWSSGIWGGEILRVESDTPVQVMSGDYDGENFGAFIPFFAAAVMLPPVADGGADVVVCPGVDVWLDGRASTDADAVPGGGVETWSWDLDVAVDSDGDTVPDNDRDADGPTVVARFPPGTTTVKLTFWDDDGEVDTDTVTVTAVDVQPPELTCLPVVTGVAIDFTGGPAAPMATATDDCDPTPVIANDRTAGGADASDFYPCGTTLVTFTATDAAGNVDSCTTRVVIAPAGVVGEVGPALRVRKVPVDRPQLDWSRVGPSGPDSRFVVLRSNRPDGTFPVAPNGGPMPEVLWVDATASGTLIFYDVRASVCDGTVSDD